MTHFIIQPWQWGIVACTLFIMELLVGGVFLLGIGIAALLMAAITFFTTGLTPSSQLVLFAILSTVSVILWKKCFQGHTSSKSPLNNRALRHVGTTHTLKMAIRGGEGLLILEDTRWSLRGPDLPIGTQVIIREFKDGLFYVEKTES